MKKITLLAATMLFSVSLFSQSKSFLGWKLTKDYPRNEVKVNLPVSIFGSFLEASYERILNTDISIGSSIGVSLDNAKRYPIKFGVMPYCRWFFGGTSKSMDKIGSGFFIEANGGVFSTPEYYASLPGDYSKNPDTEPSKETQIGLGLGLGVGWKYLSKNNWVGEIMLGGGRDFINADSGYPRFGISIGKRF